MVSVVGGAGGSSLLSAASRWALSISEKFLFWKQLSIIPAPH